MVNYRLAKVEDVEQIDALCKRENIASPFDGTTYVVVDGETVMGFINFAPITLVNSIVSDSPLSVNTLYEKMISVLETIGSKRIMAFPKNDEVENMLIKKEFKVTNQNIVTMEKVL